MNRNSPAAGARSVAVRAAALIAMLLISGCAFTTGHVQLGYQPDPAVAKIARPDSPRVAVEVNDKRPTQIVGQKINGFGMKTADVISDSDVPKTLENAFETELTNRGFTLGTGGNSIAIRLSNLQNHFTLGFFSGESTANIGMDVAVKQPSGAVVFDKYITAESQKSIELASPENAQNTLNAAIRDAVVKVFNDDEFINALQKP